MLHGRRAWYMHRLFAGLELARMPPALALRQLRALRSAWPVLERGRRVGGQAGGRPQERMVCRAPAPAFPRHLSRYTTSMVIQYGAISALSHALYSAAAIGV